jgi:transcription elongation factor Elf1
VLRDGDLNLTFRRNFGAAQGVEWAALTALMEGVSLSQRPDSVRWILEKNGRFSTASLYRELFFPGVVNKWMMSIWRASLPLKIKIFLWQICNDKIQSAEQLKKKNWSGPLECKLCGEIESTKHIFLNCALAKFSWSLFNDALEWGSLPETMDDIHCKLVEGSNRENGLFVFLFGCLAWSLWLIRNDLIFNNSVVPYPDMCIFRTISFMQRWSILHKEKAQL